MRLHQLNRPCKSPQPKQPTDEPADADQHWRQFLRARARAMETLRIGDAAIAGRAWAAFLATFTTSPPIVPEQSE